MDMCIRDFSGAKLANLSDLTQAVILKRARLMNEKLWKLSPKFYLLEIAQLVSLENRSDCRLGSADSPD
jgi:hypothetical protein